MFQIRFLQRRTFYLVLAILICFIFVANPSSVFASVDFVGDMFPASGSTTTVTPGSSFDFYISVYKGGVTPGAGQGAGIICRGYWFTMPYFGSSSVFNITETAMTYVGEDGNNDRYKATITPAVGLYQFTAWCSDDGGTTKHFSDNNSSGDGRLVVKTAGVNTCSGAAQNDNNVLYNGLNHDTFSTIYRNPGGPVTTAQGTVTLKFRTCMNDLNQEPYIRVYDLKNATEIYSPGNANAKLTFDSHANVAGVGDVTYWSFALTIPNSINIYYYVFRANDGSGQGFYRALDKNVWSGGYSNPGGQGESEASQTTAYDNSFQISIYDPTFSVPAWMQQGIVYQIFPDRFRDGNTSNDPAAGRFFYNEAGGTIFRSNSANWNTKICDPRGLVSPTCTGNYSDNFYGGDLQGIIDKINQGFFDNLGVSVIYLNPIFRSPSNHKYDTSDYLTIDPDFGTLADFQALAAASENHHIKLILDGVFNHTSSDSKYFDRYSRYDAAGNVTSPNSTGTNDASGACEDTGSSYRSWYYFSDTSSVSNPGLDTPGDSSTMVKCADPNGFSPPTAGGSRSYEAWYGYSSLPKLQANSAAVRNLIWNNGLNSVGPYWTSQGADGWRFDVGADVDGGLGTPTNNYWEGFRSAVRAVSSDTLLLGEEWDDASKWLMGTEWDSVMNYRFRSTMLAWMFTGCTGGNGCVGGTTFNENDSNASSSSGSIAYLSPSQFNARLRSIQEDYPPMAFKAMMNLEGSHDTERVRFLLKKINNDSDSAAVQRMKEWWLFTFTYAGAPTLYYGDEVGLSQDGVGADGTYQDDPYNRVPYPWDDTPGDSTADTTNLLVFERKMASIRLSYPALQDGDVQHGILIDDANKLYGFARTNGSQTALIVLNRDSAAHNATLSGLNASPYNLPDGTILYDAIEGNTYTVSAGSVTVPVNATWGVVLLEQNKIQTPAVPQSFFVLEGASQNTLQWSPDVTDTGAGRELATSYTIHRSTDANFTPDATNLLATVTPDPFGTANGRLQYTDTAPLTSADTATSTTNYYAVCALNAEGKESCGAPTAPTGDGRCPNLERPTLLTPTNKAVSAKRKVKLDWSDSFCVPTFSVVVRQGSKKGPRVDADSPGFKSEYTTKKLVKNETYFWRVTSCVGKTCLASRWFTFKISP